MIDSLPTHLTTNVICFMLLGLILVFVVNLISIIIGCARSDKNINIFLALLRKQNIMLAVVHTLIASIQSIHPIQSKDAACFDTYLCHSVIF